MRKDLLLAGIDIGTNTLRLLIAEFPRSGAFRKIESGRYITRLGEDITRTGRLKAEARERTLEVLENFSKICGRYTLDGVYAVATSAVRDASNGTEFIKMVRERTGFDVDVISGDEEARLTMLGVSSGLGIDDKDVFLMDIGGGSTEFVFASKGKMFFRASTDIGVVRYTERYIHSDPPEAGEITLLESAIEERLGALPVCSGKTLISLRDTRGDENNPPLPVAMLRGNGSPAPLGKGGKRGFEGFSGENARSVPNLGGVSFIGTAGTVTTLAAMDLQIKTYDPYKVHGYRINKERIGKIRGMLSHMTIEDRKDLPGIEAGREDIILAGAIITDKVMERFGFAEMIVSDYGLREGLVIDLYNRLSQAGRQALA